MKILRLVVIVVLYVEPMVVFAAQRSLIRRPTLKEVYPEVAAFKENMKKTMASFPDTKEEQSKFYLEKLYPFLRKTGLPETNKYKNPTRLPEEKGVIFNYSFHVVEKASASHPLFDSITALNHYYAHGTEPLGIEDLLVGFGLHRSLEKFLKVNEPDRADPERMAYFKEIAQHNRRPKCLALLSEKLKQLIFQEEQTQKAAEGKSREDVSKK